MKHIGEFCRFLFQLFLKVISIVFLFYFFVVIFQTLGFFPPKLQFQHSAHLAIPIHPPSIDSNYRIETAPH